MVHSIFQSISWHPDWCKLPKSKVFVYHLRKDQWLQGALFQKSDRVLPGKQLVAINFHQLYQLYPWNQPRLPKKLWYCPMFSRYNYIQYHTVHGFFGCYIEIGKFPKFNKREGSNCPGHTCKFSSRKIRNCFRSQHHIGKKRGGTRENWSIHAAPPPWWRVPAVSDHQSATLQDVTLPYLTFHPGNDH